MIVELHLIQNFPPSNLNRNDTGTPKDCEFGGFRRARISSQCFKHAMRQYFNDNSLVSDSRGIRTNRLYEELIRILTKEKKKPDEEVSIIVKNVLLTCGITIKETEKTEYLLMIGKMEIQAIAEYLSKSNNWERLSQTVVTDSGESEKEEKPSSEIKKKKSKKKESKVNIPKDIKDEIYNHLFRKDLADIALFGRMLADIPKENVNAACQVAQAISTNKVSMEMDFYTAIDDLITEEETGASMMGIIEFDSACFYRYMNMDFNQLKKNLNYNDNLALQTVKAFIEAAIYALPTGKQNSMSAQNPPSLILGIVRPYGYSSLANAFEKPIKPTEKASLVENSIDAMFEYWKKLNSVYPLENSTYKIAVGPNTERISDESIEIAENSQEFIQKISDHLIDENNPR